MVCALLDVLLASGHPAFGSRASRAQWRAKLHAAVAAKYPEPPEQASLPEAERDGFVPTAVLASIKVMAPSPAIPEDMDGTVSSAPGNKKRKTVQEDVPTSYLPQSSMSSARCSRY